MAYQPNSLQRGSSIERAKLASKIEEMLQILAAPTQVVELRVLAIDGKPCTASGYFDDFAKLAEWALRYDGRGSGVYFTLNPVLTALQARCYNRVREWVKLTTSDNEIVGRRWLLIDFDAIRPSAVSSTDSEHEAAIMRARECREYLTSNFGWPLPLICDSGNGAHLLYRIDLPNDEQTKKLLEMVLRSLSQIFTDQAVQIDTGVFNAARICKLYYTMAGKGDNITDRPHRRSAILEIPSSINVVDITLLRAVADLAGRTEYQDDISKLQSRSLPAKQSTYNPDNYSEVSLVKRQFDLLAYAQKHFPGPTLAVSSGETRLVGNQGLLINVSQGVWYQHGSGRGGDALDLVGYVMYGEKWNKHDRALFKTALAEAASFAGIELLDKNRESRLEKYKNEARELGSSSAQSAQEVERLLSFVLALKLEFFYQPYAGGRGRAYAQLLLRPDQPELWLLRSRLFHALLLWLYYQKTGKVLAPRVASEVAHLLEAKAFCEGKLVSDTSSLADLTEPNKPS